MKISTGILSVILTALLGLEAWTLQQVVDLKVQVGQLSVKIETMKRASVTATNQPVIANQIIDSRTGAILKVHARGTNE